jgi:ATP-dependent DNA helicase RecG
MTLNTVQIQDLIRGGESLTVEFKRDISDREIYESVVCLANAKGGVLLIGVEKGGTITGARPRHGTGTDATRLQVAIFNNTAPHINARVSLHTIEQKTIVAIEVDPYPEVCATTEGRCLRRVMKVEGPECIPFYPYEHISRRSDLGLVDYSAEPVNGATLTDLDPLEIERLRQTIERRRGDAALVSLDPRALVQALRLVISQDDTLVPNVAGLLLLGHEAAIRRFLPTHEIAFQVLDNRGNVLVNDWFHEPLIKTLEAIEQRFKARNQEQEVQVGFLRLPVPDYSPEPFREAVVNALEHRDYTRLGAVYIQFHPDHLILINPGGFPEGITLENLLVHEPKPRSPLLAEALRRIGLVETTGRGIDKIYFGQLWYGRPLPDYSQSNTDAVRLVLRGGEASLEFAALVHKQQAEGTPLDLNELLVLNQLQHERRVDAPAIGRLTQRGEAHARSVLEGLVERGLVEARGEKRGRVYHLSASLYKRLGVPAGYIRAHGFDPITQEALVLNYIKAHGRITRRETAKLCLVNGNQASYLLRRLASKGKIRPRGSKRGAYYESV